MFHKPAAKPVLYIGVAVIVGLWLLRWTDVIDGWTFTLIGLPFFLLWGLFGEMAAGAAERSAAEPEPPAETMGLDQPFTTENRQALDSALGLSIADITRLTRPNGEPTGNGLGTATVVRTTTDEEVS